MGALGFGDFDFVQSSVLQAFGVLGFHLSRFPRDWRLLCGPGRPPLVAAFRLRARDLLLASVALHIFPLVRQWAGCCVAQAAPQLAAQVAVQLQLG